MKRKLLFICLILSIVSVLAAGACSAATTYQDTIDELTNNRKTNVYNINLNAPFSKEKSGLTEMVDPESGKVYVTYELFSIQGRGGAKSIDLSLNYCNLYASDKEESVTLNTTTRLYDNTTLEKETFEKSIENIGIGWQLYLPYVEKTGERNKTVTYVHMPDGSVYKQTNTECGLEDYKLNNVKFSGDETNGYSLAFSNGDTYKFSATGYLTTKTDNKGNVVTYTWSGESINQLSAVSDNCKNTVNFTYSDTEVKISYKEKEYVLSRTTQGTSYLLTSIKDPSDRVTKLEYSEITHEYDFFATNTGVGTNTYYPLTSITYHTGIKTLYEYEKSKKWLYEIGNGYMEYTRLAKRYDYDGSGNINIITYTYSGEPTGYPEYKSGELPENYFYTTTEKSSSGKRTVYTYNKNHDQIKKQISSDENLYTEETRVFDDTTRMPKLFISKTRGQNDDFMTVYTETKFDTRGNVISTTTYQDESEKPLNTREYKYSTFDLCVYESGYIDEGRKLEIERTPNPGGFAFASQTVKENGVVLKQDFYTYDSYSNLSQSKEQTGETDYLVTTYRYNSPYSGLYPTEITVSGVKNADGESESYTIYYDYNEYGECIKQTNAEGGTKIFEYDTAGRTVAEHLEDGCVRLYEYNDTDNIIKTTDANSFSLLYYYDKCGRMISVKDGNLTLLSREYDSSGRCVKETDAEGNYTTYSYDALDRYTNINTYSKDGTLVSSASVSYDDAVPVLDGIYSKMTVTSGDAFDTRTEQYLFDYRELLAEKTISGGGQARVYYYEYDLAGNPVLERLPSGAETKTKYNAFGNPVYITYADVTYESFEYDFNGNCISASNALGETSYFTYDNLSRLVKSEIPAPNGISVSKTYYNSLGGATLQVDAMGGKTTTEYNLRGFATAVRSYNTGDSGIETLYEYNGEGVPVKMSTGAIGSDLKHTTTYDVDRYGRVLSETDPSGNSQYFEYDNNGNLIKSTDRMGITTTSKYDPLGNVVRTENSANGITEYTYNYFGELVQIADESSSKSYTYNAFGDVTSAKDGYTTETFEYTADGALAKRTATDRDLQDNITTYQYNPAGRLISVTTPLGTEQISYDEAGRITAKSNETSGISKTYSYYTGGLVKRIDTLRDNTLIFYEYNEYNPAGNKTYTDLNGNVTEYTYDGLNRLASTTENGKITSYEFDEYNNISSKYELTDTTLTTTSYFYDNNNRLLLEESGNDYIRYEYDASGNLLQKMPSSGADSYYKYDGYGRLTEVIAGDSVAEYTYAPDGLRQSKTVNGKYTRFVYENGSVSAEITEGNTYNYYRGTELMGYTTHTGDLYYYISDSHGNIVSVTDVLGVHTKDYSYDAYGNQKAFSVNPQGDMSVVYQWQSENENIYNPFRYCGEYTDEETGFVYLRNRYYDSSIGRFITEDPARDGLNWYVYCGNNPVMFVDPLGLAPTPEEAAAMAEHIYKDIPLSDNSSEAAKVANRKARTIAGWRLIDVWYGQESMKMGIYIRDSDDWQNPSEYAVVFKGTSTWFDNGELSSEAWNNIEAATTGKATDMWDALDYSKGFVNSHSGKEVTFVGHSKGGGEAIAAADYMDCNAITFNAANFHFSKYVSGKGTGTINNYYVKGEILHPLIGTASIGTTHWIPLQYLPDLNLSDSVVTIVEKIADAAVLNHGIAAVRQGLN